MSRLVDHDDARGAEDNIGLARADGADANGGTNNVPAAMHHRVPSARPVCSAALLGYGLALVYGRRHFVFAGAFAFLCMSITYHAIYNLLFSGEGVVRIAGDILPVATAAVLLFFLRRPGGLSAPFFLYEQRKIVHPLPK